MITVLMAHGPNGIRIPALFWSDYDAALAHATEILGEPSSENSWSVWEDREGFLYVGTKENYYAALKRCEGSAQWEDIFSTYLKKADTKELFKYYYNGCGGVYRFSLEICEEGKPCINFDLD